MGYKVVGIYDLIEKRLVLKRAHRLIAETFIRNEKQLP